MADIVVSEFMDEGIIDSMFAGYDVIFDPDLADNVGALSSALENARALIVRNRTQVNEELLRSAASLTVLGRLGVGLDNIDLQACKSRGISVCPATGANDLAVAEYVITAALVLLRRAWFTSAQVASGHWPRMTSIGREMFGKQVGLVGFGAIARQTATRAIALGMTVVAYDPYLSSDDEAWGLGKQMELDELLSTSDVVSLHLPLTDETHHLIDARTVAKMQKRAILINAARGGIVDEAALVAALISGHLGGAALDVFESEPVKPAVGLDFESVPNLILTPHIAGVTEESNVRVSRITAENVLRYLSLKKQDK